MKILTIVGARPQFVKAAMVSDAIAKWNTDNPECHIEEIMVHTGQHYDDNMSGVFFRQLGIPAPKYNLGVSGGSQIDNLSRMMTGLESTIIDEQPDAVLIYGDTNSSLAGALTAAKLGFTIVHVEAGDRADNKNNPEELNRTIIDHISNLLLCTTETAKKNLASEGIRENVFAVGNLMGEALLKYASKPWDYKLLVDYSGDKVLAPDEYYYLTCHRQENTANDDALREILMAMESLDLPTVFPVHPRNKERATRLIKELGCTKILAVEPVGYFESVHLIKGAKQVVTDSGGVLTETFFTGVPYVYVMDMPKIPKRTPFDVGRLARPLKDDILAKLQQPFDATVGLALCKKNAGTGLRILEKIEEWHNVKEP
ncbi:UDP-N-acetyl glucosamine 2-epimerase [Anaerovibrio lipolyticus]|uniref:UDP-N-acetyl glucosamine 2-epimerase n=1 Tax=Anaerovibrio lipolyticus TaxID=82374 RepID=UPI00068619CF|nr:UDP-N-acetyl glucosamine 2-epimerase [Anaerovibrio lipolyticus]